MTNTIEASYSAYQKARAVLPGGSSRVTTDRTPIPIFMESGNGAHLFDVDGNRYLDLNNNFTTLIHGHNFAPINHAITTQLQAGACFANPTRSESALAEMLCERVPAAETVRFVSTGTEAVMFAIRAARAITGRTMIAKFEGAYHGAYDWAAISQASAPENWGDSEPVPVAPDASIPASVLDEVLVLPFNDAVTTRDLLQRFGGKIACLLVDLVPSRAGLLEPKPEFLEAMADAAQKHGFLIVDDEVLNFRQGFHGAAAGYGLVPDLVVLGKIIGGGLPIGAIAGRHQYMAAFDSSEGPPLVSQGGTFAANPLSLAAGIASLTALDVTAFETLKALGDALRRQLREAIERRRAPFSVSGSASLFRIHPKAEAPSTYRAAFQTSAERSLMKTLTKRLLDSGVFFSASAVSSLSTPMTADDLQKIVEAFERFLDHDL